MIIETQAQEQTVAAPLVQAPLIIIQDCDLVQVGGGMPAACHF